MIKQLRAYLYAHHSALALSFRNLSLAPLASLVTIAAIGLCLSLPFGLYLVTLNVQKFCANWDHSASITLYVDANSTPKQMQKIVNTARSFPFVGTTTTFTADYALKEFQSLSGINDILSLLPENPLPAVISIQLNDMAVSSQDIDAFRQTMLAHKEVEQMTFDQAWMQKLQAMLSYGKNLTHFLYLIVGFGVLFVIGNIIRLSLEQHRDEMEVLQLIGATMAFIRRPFLYRGAIYGFLSGTIAALVLSLALLFFRTPTQEVTSLFDALFKLEYLHFSDTLTILGLSTLLGWVGAFIAFMQQHSALQYDSSNIY